MKVFRKNRGETSKEMGKGIEITRKLLYSLYGEDQPDPERTRD